MTEERVKSLLAQVCGTDAVLKEGIDLLDSGLLDSLAFIDLLAELDSEGIEIHLTQVDRNRFRRVESIITLVQEIQNR